jgi:hypothetical protein
MMAVTMYELVQAAVAGKEVECRACGCGDEGVIGKLYRSGIRLSQYSKDYILPAIYHEGSHTSLLRMIGWKWEVYGFLNEPDSTILDNITIL